MVLFSNFKYLDPEKSQNFYAGFVAWEVKAYEYLALGSGLAERMHACSVTQPCPTLCYPMDYRSPGSSVHGILHAKILEWVAIPFSSRKNDPWPRTLCHFTTSIYIHQIVWELSILWLQKGLKLKLFFISAIIFLHQT